MPSWKEGAGRPGQRAHGRANERSKRLRRAPTPSEARLWKALRGLNREGAHFRRQPALGDWVFDFADLSARLLVEVDGGVHERLADVAVRDLEKDAWAENAGFRLVRVSNEDVWERLDRVIETIRASFAAPHPQPPPRKGEGE